MPEPQPPTKYFLQLTRLDVLIAVGGFLLGVHFLSSTPARDTVLLVCFVLSILFMSLLKDICYQKGGYVE